MDGYCNNYYTAIGTREQNKALYTAISEIEDDRHIHEERRIEALVDRLGGDKDARAVRGVLHNVMLYGDKVKFVVETYEEEPSELRHFLEKCFPGMKIYYASECEIECFFFTNRDTSRYYLFMEGNGLTGVSYPESEEELCREVTEYTLVPCHNEAECRKALADYNTAYGKENIIEKYVFRDD